MGSRWHDERGASAILVAMALLLLFGAGAIAVDLGAGFETKRNLVTDTDSGATAAARAAAQHGVGCSSPTVRQSAVDHMSANLGETIDESDLVFDCQPAADPADPNIVTVDFTESAKQTLSGALGASELDVFSRSVAQFDGLSAGFMRPISTCITEPELAGALATPPDESNPVVFAISMSKTWKAPACGGAPGDWGWLCFATNCGQSDVKHSLKEGYEGFLTLGQDPPRAWNDPGSDEDCAPGGPTDDWCQTKNGTGGKSVESELESLVDRAVRFPILVTDQVDNAGGGEVHPFAFAYVSLQGFCYDKKGGGSQTIYGDMDAAECDAEVDLTDNNPLVLKFHLYGLETVGTPKSFFNFGDESVRLCGVDHDTVAHRCQR